MDYSSIFNSKTFSFNEFNSREAELRLLLESLEVDFPITGRDIREGFFVSHLTANAAKTFEANQDKAVLLSFEVRGVKYPLSIFFLTNDTPKKFGHSSLILDEYPSWTPLLNELRTASERFFNRSPDDLMGSLHPDWTQDDLGGLVDRRPYWNSTPNAESFAPFFPNGIPALPVFPSVYPYNNPYLAHLAATVLPLVKTGDRILVFGVGTGLDAALVAMKVKSSVDAVDINPVAVANTKVIASRTGTLPFVNVWVSDCFSAVKERYDFIIFNAPLAIDDERGSDSNRFDQQGKLLRKVLEEVPQHLRPKGRLFLMSHPDIEPYSSSNCVLEKKVVKNFEAGLNLAILEISVSDSAAVLPSVPTQALKS